MMDTSQFLIPSTTLIHLMLIRSWTTIRKERVKTTVPITTLAFTEGDRNVLGISTCCAYQFIQTNPGMKTKLGNFFSLGIWVFVIALIVRYIANRFKFSPFQ